jgi:hypothetical protein
VGGQEYVLLQSVLCQLCKSGIGSVSMFWGCINNCIVKENIIILEFILLLIIFHCIKFPFFNLTDIV